jgi:hypothetical protein
VSCGLKRAVSVVRSGGRSSVSGGQGRRSGGVCGWAACSVALVMPLGVFVQTAASLDLKLCSVSYTDTCLQRASASGWHDVMCE